MLKSLFFAAILLVGLVFMNPAKAQDKIDLIGGYNDWDAFTLKKPGGELMCYMVSVPKSWKASKDDVSRGEIYITVTHRPKADVRDQVNAVVGYPFKNGSEAKAWSMANPALPCSPRGMAPGFIHQRTINPWSQPCAGAIVWLLKAPQHGER